MTNANTLPPPTGPPITDALPEDPRLHRNFRVLVMGAKPETNEAFELVKPIGKKLGERSDGSVVKDYALDTRRDPEQHELKVVDGIIRPNLERLPNDETWLGNFQKIPASAFTDVETAEKYLKNPNYRFGNKAVRRIMELVQNRSESILLRGRRAIAGKTPPPGVPYKGTDVIDQATGERKYIPGLEDLVPTANEKPVSSRDFAIEIDKLESERRKLRPYMGKNPGETGYVPLSGIVNIKVKDAHGKQPWEEGYADTSRWYTVPTRDEMEAYLSKRHTKDTSDPRLDYFLKSPQLRQEVAAPVYKDTLMDRMLVRLQLKLGHNLGEMHVFSGETMTAIKNKAANEIVQTTQATGPDSILRAIDRCVPNEHGGFVDVKSKKPISLSDLFKREEMIHLLSEKSELMIGLFNYAKTKWSTEQIGELVEYFFDLAHEAHIPDDVFIGHMIGAFYGDKMEDNAWKNSLIVHPVKRHESGPLKGHEIWNVRLDEKTRQPYFEDVDGNAWLGAELITDQNTGRMYHESKTEVDSQGNPIKNWIKYELMIDPATGGRVFAKNPDGLTLKKVVDYIDADGVTHYRNVPLFEPAKVMDPEYDMDKWVVGKIDLLAYVTEIGRRFRAGEFAFREGAMSALYLRVAELAEVMNASEYIPGFVMSKEVMEGKATIEGREIKEAISLDDFRGRTNVARALGRDSEMFRVASYAMSMLWIGLSENLKQNYGGGDKEEDKEARMQAFMERQKLLTLSMEEAENEGRTGMSTLRELDPKFYSGSAISNQFLKEMVLILDASAKRFPSIKKPPIGDSLILGPNGQGQDILPLY